MKKLATAIAAIALIGTSAFAADMAVKAPPPPPAPACTWCGFYIGADGGGDWARQSATTTAFPSPGFGAPGIGGVGFAGIGMLPTAHSLNSSGGLAGVDAGYNWQVNNWLVGVEGDWMWLNRNANNTQTTFNTTPPPTTPNGSMAVSSNNHWLASARGRLGVIVQPQWMLYVTGGAAWTRTSTTATWTQNGSFGAAVSASSVSFDGTKTGFVVGAGAEWMFAPHWIVRAEYLYYQFDGASATLPFNLAGGVAARRPGPAVGT